MNKLQVLKAGELKTLSNEDLLEELEHCLFAGQETQLKKYWNYAKIIKREIISRILKGEK